MDRDRGFVDFEAVADIIMKNWSPGGDNGGRCRSFIVTALNYAQRSGARFAPRKTIAEEDYADGVAAACEAFAATLKDKGLLS